MKDSCWEVLLYTGGMANSEFSALIILYLKLFVGWVWGDGLIGVAFTAHAGRTECKSTLPTEMHKHWVCMVHPRAWETETETEDAGSKWVLVAGLAKPASSRFSARPCLNMRVRQQVIKEDA